MSIQRGIATRRRLRHRPVVLVLRLGDGEVSVRTFDADDLGRVAVALADGCFPWLPVAMDESGAPRALCVSSVRGFGDDDIRALAGVLSARGMTTFAYTLRRPVEAGGADVYARVPGVPVEASSGAVYVQRIRWGRAAARVVCCGADDDLRTVLAVRSVAVLRMGVTMSAAGVDSVEVTLAADTDDCFGLFLEGLRVGGLHVCASSLRVVGSRVASGR